MDQATHDLLVKFVYLFASAVLPVLAGLAATYAIQGIRLLQEKIKSARPDVYAQLDMVIKMGVYAAEQAGIAGYTQNKKEFALEFIQKELADRGLGLFDVKQLESKIEAAVYAEINKSRV